MAPPGDKRLRGYAEIGISSLILGTAATLIQVSTMPSSMLVVLRMGLAGAVLALVFFLTGGLAEVRRNGKVRRMWLVGFVVAAEMLFYYLSVRLSNVTIAVSLEYLAPVWVVIAAPLVLHTRRQRIDVIAIGIALGGMALILAPTLASAAASGSVPRPRLRPPHRPVVRRGDAHHQDHRAGCARLDAHAVLLHGQRDPPHAARRVAEPGRATTTSPRQTSGSCS